ncbi:Tetraacyldisaccharide 4'-kinase [hydrothermal vent metagenome]|uniref:tetraacyldisaccharide 4'-kinase n=1 Tax=hydrothermal vent metagenome TaxID=652676 RepID=A0A3B1CWT7_9ZZZZ
MKQFLYTLATDRRNDFWAKLLKCFLWFFSGIYARVVRIILWSYRVGLRKQQHLPKPVISVGNITLGGVGKTPFVIFLARLFQRRGLKPVILTRGYMESKHKSDEVKVIEENLKDISVLVGANRFANAQEFLKNNNVDVFILDDGFQHWKLYRDLDIVAIDATDPFGNAQVIPRGILREPLDGLKRANLCVATKTDLPGAKVGALRQKFRAFNTEVPFVEASHKPVSFIDVKSSVQKELEFFKEKTVMAFCSLGKPESFENTLIKLDIKVKKHFVFIDHHMYTYQDIVSMVQYARECKIDTFVTTQKDAVKLSEFLNEFKEIDIVFLKIEMNIISGKEQVIERVFSVL